MYIYFNCISFLFLLYLTYLGLCSYVFKFCQQCLPIITKSFFKISCHLFYMQVYFSQKHVGLLVDCPRAELQSILHNNSDTDITLVIYILMGCLSLADSDPDCTIYFFQ